MHFSLQITQRLNKLIRSLRQRKFRDQNSLFVAEGEKLCVELLESEFVPELFVIREYPSADAVEIAENFSERGVPVYSCPKTQFDQLSNTKSPQGILSVVNFKETPVIDNESFIALDGISDPGNVGTIIRTADWFGIRQVILGKGCSDKYNPKVVRSTMGAIFRTTIVQKVELSEFLPEHFKGFEIYGASLESDKNIEDLSPKDKYGIVFGHESQGISDQVKEIITNDFKIRGDGDSESLNVATAVGISLYQFNLDKNR